MESERMQALTALKQQLNNWHTANAIALEQCPNCRESINPMDDEKVCEACNASFSDAMIEHGADGADLLEMVPRVVTRLRISYGGPSAFIDYDHNTGRATFFTSQFGDGVEIDLMPNESADMEELFQLEANKNQVIEDGEL